MCVGVCGLAVIIALVVFYGIMCILCNVVQSTVQYSLINAFPQS